MNFFKHLGRNLLVRSGCKPCIFHSVLFIRVRGAVDSQRFLAMDGAKYLGKWHWQLAYLAIWILGAGNLALTSADPEYFAPARMQSVVGFNQTSIWVYRSPTKEKVFTSKAATIRCATRIEGDPNRRQLMLVSGLNSCRGRLQLPMPVPDLRRCHDPYLPPGSNFVNCCPPFSATAIDFQFPTDLPLRIRRPAHMVDEEYMEKYTRAVQLMKELPPDDPRSFSQQANVHCAYSQYAYYTGSLSLELNVHNSWFFMPWHRLYIYFHERILAKLIGDDSFALPFWNWDSPEGMSLPPMYANKGPLYDELRDAAHQPPAPVDLDFDGTDMNRTVEEAIAANNNLMYRNVVSNAKTTSLFHGLPFRYGDHSDPGAGTVEVSPHNTMHTWTGSRSQPNVENMGTFYSAGRDPIFFAHHANVDRIWTIWKTLGGERRKDYTDADFLASRFLFYDENAQLVSASVADAMDHTKLRYAYRDVGTPAWVNARPVTTRIRSVVPSSAEVGFQSKRLIAPLTVRVKRPNPKRSEAEIEATEEVLSIEGVKVKRDRFMKFDVFINFPEADSTTSVARAEYAGSFTNVPQRHNANGGYRKSTFRVGISEMLEDLGASEDESIVVTIVPKGDIRDPISISTVKIAYD